MRVFGRVIKMIVEGNLKYYLGNSDSETMYKTFFEIYKLLSKNGCNITGIILNPPNIINVSFVKVEEVKNVK